jgi:hypothetical protein
MADNPEFSALDFPDLVQPTLTRNLTNAITQLYFAQTDPGWEKYKVDDAADALRKAYLQIFQTQNDNYADQPTWWIDTFKLTGQEMVEAFKKTLKLENKEIPPNWNVPLKYGDNVHYFDEKNRVFMIGRLNGCDVRLLEARDLNGTATSRLHSIVYLMPEFNIILVVDVGSATGIRTLKRGSNMDLVDSLPDSRKIIILNWTEFAKLRFHTEDIVLNFKECVVCTEKPREHMFNCGHYCVCKGCSDKLMTCPLCRQVIIDRQMTDRHETNTFI